jgi:anaerobic magnesium-protoporphyrin IX monomethyl ester cyclase
MKPRVLLVSVPFADIEQTEHEKEYWKWHYALKSKLTYRNLTDEQMLKFGNIEHQNIGVLSIASYLINNGVEIKYLAPSSAYNSKDREDVFLKKVLYEIEVFRPNFVGFSAITYNMPIAFYYSKTVKEKYPEIKTIIGGAHANGVSGETLTELIENFDFVIRGKGEVPFLNLVKGNINSLGISYRMEGKDVINPTCMTSVNNYPEPVYGLLEVDKLPAARVYSSLGCRSKNQCIFCGDILHNKDFVIKDISNVIDEIKFLYNNYSSRHFFFGDENFFFNKNRALQIMRELSKCDLDITVSYQVRIEDADEELIKTASELGKCTEIHCGVESLSQEVLNINNKGLRIESVKKFCELSKKYGISNHCYFLTGLPGETEETSYLTISKIEEYINAGLIDMVEYRIAMPYPGTPMADFSEKFGVKIKHRMWDYYKGERMPPFDLESLTAERLYEIYLEGMDLITKAYKKKYLQSYSDKFTDLKALGTVVSGGF